MASAATEHIPAAQRPGRLTQCFGSRSKGRSASRSPKRRKISMPFLSSSISSSFAMLHEMLGQQLEVRLDHLTNRVDDLV